MSTDQEYTKIDLEEKENKNEDEEWAESDSDEELESLIQDNNPTSEAYRRLERLDQIKTCLNYIALTLTAFALCFLIFFVAHDHLQSKPLVEISGFNVDRVDSPSLNTHFDPDEYGQYGRTYNDDGSIKRIVVLGERNSGLEQLAFRLSRCYPDIEVTTHFTRMGYWFQDTKDKYNQPLTLVVGVFLNVYDWVDLMRQNPLHAPNHENMDWKRFVTEPWTMTRPVSDMEYIEEKGKNCQQDFAYDEVIPCHIFTYKDKYPVYEKNPTTKKTFNSILELRTEKIHNFFSTMYMEQVHSFVSVKFEELMNNGVIDLLGRIELSSGLIGNCPGHEDKIFNLTPFSATKEEAFYAHMLKEVDWSAEMLVGYKAGDTSERTYSNMVTKDDVLELYDYESKETTNDDDLQGLLDMYESKEKSLNNFQNALVDDDVTDLHTPPIKNNNPPATHTIGKSKEFWDDYYDNDYFIQALEKGDDDDATIQNSGLAVNEKLDDFGLLSPLDFTDKKESNDLNKILSDYNPHHQNKVDGHDFGTDDFNQEEINVDKKKVGARHDFGTDDFTQEDINVDKKKVGARHDFGTDDFNQEDINVDKKKVGARHDFDTDDFNQEDINVDKKKVGARHDFDTDDFNQEDINVGQNANTQTSIKEQFDIDGIEDLMNDYFADLEDVRTQVDKDKSVISNQKDQKLYDPFNDVIGTDDVITTEKKNTNNWADLYDNFVQDKDGWTKAMFTDWDNSIIDKKDKELADEKEKFSGWQDKYENIKDSKKPKVERLVILAERNSGLGWFYKKISSCYPQLKVSTTLVRPGFLFQTPKQSLDVPTVILSLFVHPYTWVELMRKNPLYAPHHKNLSWQDFVSAPWNVINQEKEDELPIDAQCQYNFKKNYIVPCNPKPTENEQDKPVYELEINGSGHAYSSIIDLRADKIINHLRTATWDNVIAFLSINYETLMRPGEFDKLLQTINADAGGTLNSNCDTSTISDFIAPSLSDDEGYDSNYEYVKWMDDNLDWNIENMIGYHLDSF